MQREAPWKETNSQLLADGGEFRRNLIAAKQRVNHDEFYSASIGMAIAQN